jgi:hypothetical protein
MRIALLMGLGATLGMDLWNAFLKRAFDIRSLDYGLLGRWVLHLPAGTWFHEKIAASPPRRNERLVGWLAHYSIGVGLAVAFVALVGESWLARPAIGPALLYGVATLVFPFFVLQPALGLGVASAKAPNPAAARWKSLGTHLIFGLGLYLVAKALQRTPLLGG